MRLDPQTDTPPQRALSLRAPPGTPLYVHLPFCVAKCTYCDFFSVAAEGEDTDGALDALLAEAALRAPQRPRSVFFGGGTPSWYGPEALTRLLDGLDACTGFRASAREVTLECNPESLTLAKARLLRHLGVDRLSIGVQSLRPRILELFGRVHDAQAALAAYHAARAAGFRRVSLDVIYAVPGQRIEEWMEDLDILLALRPDHLSAYHLAYEPGTLLTKWEEDGRLERLDEELERRFFLATRQRLHAAGLVAYELSNFALSGQHCRHNVHYWRNGDYAGLGPSAVSALAGTRFGNPRSIGAWRRAVTEGRLAASWEETLEPKERLGETWWLGLRMSAGVLPARARALAGRSGLSGALPAHDACEPLARRLLADGWLETVGARGARFRLSPAGLPVGDAIARRFLEV